MTQNQEKIENNFHGNRVMYGGFTLLDHSLLLFSVVFLFVCFFIAFLWGFSNNVADKDFTTVKLNLVDRPWYQIHKT